MSGLGKKGGEGKVGLEELEREYAASIEKIRKLLGGKSDTNDIKNDDKQKLRSEYLRASQLAKKLSARYADGEKAEKYASNSKKLRERAQAFGSAIESKIPDTTFDDVKGLEEVKNIVKSFIFMAENPDIVKYYKLEGGLGLMMYGAPGTGKTMFAEAIANALQLPLFVITPADIFKSYVGESEAAVRQIFDEIDACPDGAILFLDECESILSRRTQDTKDYKAAVTTELLQRLNGFGVDGSKRIIVAATNRPDVIDPAYLRFKRFSHRVHVTPPDREAKRAIIESKLKGIELSDITSEEVLNMTETYTRKKLEVGSISVVDSYYSAADICGIIEEACRLALEQIQKAGANCVIPLTREMFEKAFAKLKPSISAEMLKEYENF